MLPAQAQLMFDGSTEAELLVRATAGIDAVGGGLMSANERDELVSTKAERASQAADAIEALVVLLNPFTPHLAEEGWSMLGKSESVNKAPWPEYDEKYCEDTVVTVAIQVNGKVRAKMEIEKDTSADDAIATALGMSQVAKWIEDKDIKKSIYVPGRIVNVVVVPKK